MLSVAGNLTIISLTLMDGHLRTAMYLFLQNFSFLEISFTTACIPRFLYNISTGDKVITYTACAVQVFFTYLFGITEFFLLATMSFDSYVAICKPLHYVTIMNNRVCHRLIISCWMAGLLIIIPPLSLGLNLEFCDSNVIDHFFLWCHSPPKDIMLRHMVHRENDSGVCCLDFHHDSCVCGSVLHVYHHDNSKILFFSAKEKSLFNLFFPHGCSFHYPWQLHLHLY